jgi:hypothetical protein
MEVVFQTRGIYKYSDELYNGLISAGIECYTLPYSGGCQYKFVDDSRNIYVTLIKDFFSDDISTHIKIIEYWEGRNKNE